MNRAMFSIVLLALLAHSCIAKIVINSTGLQDLDHLSQAAVDISMTCYGDPGNAVGIIGDKDGSILKALRLNHFIPVALVDQRGIHYDYGDTVKLQQLQVFVIVLHSRNHFITLIYELKSFIWWNYYANFLIVDARPGPRQQCSNIGFFMHVTNLFGMLNVQFICRYGKPRRKAIAIVTSNPFVRRAPEGWSFFGEYKKDYDTPTSFLFARRYGEGGRSCESINFDKTRNVGGYPLRFITKIQPSELELEVVLSKQVQKKLGKSFTLLLKSIVNKHRWLIDNIVIALNVSAVVSNKDSDTQSGIYLHPRHFSTGPEMNAKYFDRIIMPLSQSPMFAVTQHTGHKSQLAKILSVIDKTSRIGMWVVYLITFLFFKFFLGQAVMPAVLNIVRLTCNTGLPTLPQTFAPTLFLASLLMFVVTLQGIYTGNLATLLTTTIPYPNVLVKEDIPKLGYTIYVKKDFNTKLIADPSLEGCVIEIPRFNTCIEYVVSDPLAVCVMSDGSAILESYKWKLHVSRDPILHEYIFFVTAGPNLFQRRIEGVLRTLNEAGLHRSGGILDRLRLMFVDDSEVRKNTVRRVMTFDDLRFAFVILGVGLSCSFICFIGEIVICRIRFKIAKRRDRVRVRAAWGVNAKKCSSFPSLNCRFNLRRLFSNRR